MAREERKDLLRRIGADFDGVDIHSTSDAWLKAVHIARVYNIFAWACTENDMVRLDLLGYSGQVNEVQVMHKT